jgi:hypothetical protein
MILSLKTLVGGCCGLIVGLSAGCKEKPREAAVKVTSEREPPAVRSPAASAPKSPQPPAKPASGLLDIKDLMADGELTPQEMDMYVRSFPDGKDPVKYWNFLRGVPLSDLQKTVYYSSVMSAMGSKGMLDEARKLIDESFGAGKLRTTMLGSLYAHSTLDIPDLIAVAKSIKSGQDRQAVGNAIALKVRGTADLAAMDWSALGSLQPEDAFAVAQGLATRVAAVNGRDKALAELGNGLAAVDRLVSAGQADQAMVGGFLKQVSLYVPFDGWEALQPRRGQFDPQQLDAVECGIATAMASKDPARTMPLVTQEGVSPAAAAQVTGMWLQQDNRASSEWIASNWEKLPLPQADAIAEANVRYDLANGDRASAAKWAALARGEAARGNIQALLQPADGK